MHRITELLDHRVGSLVAAAVAGLCIAASVPPWGWWPLAFVGIALLDRVIAGRGAKQRFGRGFVAGLVWFVPASAWMVAFTIPGWVIFGLWGALVLGAASAAIPPHRGRPLALPAVLVILSFVMWRFPFGGVPLATLAMSQVQSPLALLAPLSGSLLIVGAVGVVAVGMRAALARRWPILALSAAVLCLAAVLSGLSPRSTRTDSLVVAVVQGGGPQGTRALYTSAREVFDRHLEATGTIDPAMPEFRDVNHLDLIVWPENAVTTQGSFLESSEYDEVAALANELNVPIVTSIFEIFETENYNATVIVYPDGAITNRYDKVIRVPFGEYVPFRRIIEPFAPEYLPPRDAVGGTQPNVLVAPGVGTNETKLGVSISWEVFFARRSRAAVNDGAELLINPTNGSSYTYTIVQSQQVASSQLRALETDRWMLQAAPTGFSAIIDDDGKVIQRSGISEQTVLYGRADVREGTTWATRFGDWPMTVVSLLALSAAWVIARRHPAAPAISVSGGGDFDEHGDGPIVDELDGHLGAEPTGGDDEAAVT